MTGRSWPSARAPDTARMLSGCSVSHVLSSDTARCLRKSTASRSSSAMATDTTLDELLAGKTSSVMPVSR